MRLLCFKLNCRKVISRSNVQRLWHRKLVAKKYDGSAKVRKAGRPPVSAEKIKQVLHMAKSNPSWGYTRIANVMKHLNLPISRSTVKRILDAHGIVPDPKSKQSLRWKDFIKSHFHVLAATDFFSVEVLTKSGLIRYMVLFVIDIKTRKVEIAGVKHDPNGKWMKQMARNLTDSFDGFLLGKEYLIHDRDPLFCHSFNACIEQAGIETIKLPPFSPNLNAYAERFVQTIKHECLNKLIITSEDQLWYVITEFMKHYHLERPHMGLSGDMIKPTSSDASGKVIELERLGGLLKSYHRVAA